MSGLNLEGFNLSDRDLDFVIGEAAPQFKSKERLKQLIRDDSDFRKALVGDEKVFRKVMSDEDIFLKISPSLFFEILLRRTLKELGKASHTVEMVAGEQIPVFDAKAVVSLLNKEEVLDYLTDMLASFTRTENYVIPVRVRKGVWRKIRFSDMDVDALSRLCEVTDEEQRLSLYKRIADVCLFILGIFPEYALPDYSYPPLVEVRSVIRKGRKTVQEYEEEGRKFYKLAAEHQSAKALELSQVFWLLHENFNVAKKPLNFISQHYIYSKKRQLFAA
jgi:hypothetical protein